MVISNKDPKCDTIWGSIQYDNNMQRLIKILFTIQHAYNYHFEDKYKQDSKLNKGTKIEYICKLQIHVVHSHLFLLHNILYLLILSTVTLCHSATTYLIVVIHRSRLMTMII